jgi:glycosyltransferase involved in cell wall biosynthesis
VTIPPALTAAEAMAVGLPVVGTDVTCLTAILRDGVNGRVVPVDDPAALGDAIADVVGAPETWSRLSEGAVHTIATAGGWDAVAAAAAAAYGIGRSAPERAASGAGEHWRETG